MSEARDRYNFWIVMNHAFKIEDVVDYVTELESEKEEMMEIIQFALTCNRYNFYRFCRNVITPFLKKHGVGI